MKHRFLPALAAGVALAMSVVACSNKGGSAGDENSVAGQCRPEDCIRVPMAVSSEKIDLLTEMAKGFNATQTKIGDKRIAVDPKTKASGAGAQQLIDGWQPSSDDPQPVIWTPAASSWGQIVDQRLSEKGAKVGWRGLLVGDMSQPRGGPMLTGHASHQVGLDADIWLTPMPNRELTRAEREEMSATMMVAPDRKDVDPNVWTPAHTAIIKAAAEEPEVERIFVNAAIKKALCREAGDDRAWLNKVRQYWQHDYHFHVRIHCPADSPDCKPQPAVPAGDGCGKDLDWWFTDAVLHPKPQPPPTTPPPPRPQVTLNDLPPACRQVLNAP